MNKSFALLMLMSLLLAFCPPTFAQQQATPHVLQGGVEDDYVVPADGGDTMRVQTPVAGAANTVASVQQATVSEDSAKQVQQTQIDVQWDAWRNRLARAVFDKFTENRSGPFYSTQFTDDALATYTYTVTNDRRVENVQIKKPSIYPLMDSLIVSSIYELNYSPDLAFPPGSKRESVTVEEQLGVGDGGFNERQYNDSEHVTETGN